MWCPVNSLWPLSILLLLISEISQPGCLPAPLHRLPVVSSLFLANIRAVADVHRDNWPNTGQKWVLCFPILV